MTALYLERFLNYGLTPGELQSGRPVIGIAQSANDLAPCNRAHLQTVTRLQDGVRDALRDQVSLSHQQEAVTELGGQSQIMQHAKDSQLLGFTEFL